MKDIECRIHVRLKTDTIFFGNGLCTLLELVEVHKSLRIASKEMGMSYSKSLRVVKIAERELDFLILERTIGGPTGGGSALTPEGKAFLTKYQAFRDEVNESMQIIFDKYYR